MNTSEVLNKAADLIEQRGWAKGVEAMSADPSQPVCLEGAIAAIVETGIRTDDPSRLNYPLPTCPAYMAVSDYLGVSRLFVWNDEQRGATSVIEVLRACAVIEASREREAAEVTA